MKRITKLPEPRRFFHQKENCEDGRPHGHKNQEDTIDQWKQVTGRVILTQTLNENRTKKYSLASKSRQTTTESVTDSVQQNPRKMSSIEFLKREAMFLEEQTIEHAHTPCQLAKTQPTVTPLEILPLKMDNWVKTSSNNFFRSQERHSVLEQKRSKIKRLRKIDLFKINVQMAGNTKMFREEFLKEISETNKPLIVYPFMDSWRNHSAGQRVPSTPLIKCKRNFKKQKKSFDGRQTRSDSAQTRTASSWKSDSKFPPNSQVEIFDNLLRSKYPSMF